MSLLHSSCGISNNVISDASEVDNIMLLQLQENQKARTRAYTICIWMLFQ